mmetsp:Transcript_82857/g.221397  ORF Transcript_82857/g.221397 Transcript_82857/m.221397 type:complete len:211 (-) Transcript_82857:112-744(-)
MCGLTFFKTLARPSATHTFETWPRGMARRGIALCRFLSSPAARPLTCPRPGSRRSGSWTRRSATAAGRRRGRKPIPWSNSEPVDLHNIGLHIQGGHHKRRSTFAVAHARHPVPKMRPRSALSCAWMPKLKPATCTANSNPLSSRPAQRQKRMHHRHGALQSKPTFCHSKHRDHAVIPAGCGSRRRRIEATGSDRGPCSDSANDTQVLRRK